MCQPRKLLLLFLVTGLVAVAIAMPASATVSGTNGQIAYGNNNQVFVANPDGSHNQLLESNTCCASWSPNGARIALAASSPDGRITTATVNPDGSAYTLMPLPDATLNLGPASPDSWSPDGTRFALQGWDNTNPSRNGVYTIATNGSDLVRVTTGNDVPADFSPDGTRIAFFRENTDSKFALFVVSANGGPVTQISGWQNDFGSASWSPDGQWIISDDGKGSLYLVHPDGSHEHDISLPVADRYFAFTPDWSPDGKKIIFGLFTVTGKGTGQEAIYTANADGSDLQATGLQGDTPDWGTHPITP